MKKGVEMAMKIRVIKNQNGARTILLFLNGAIIFLYYTFN
jgi:hypothetical protein